MISDRISYDIPPQLVIFNMVIPILMQFHLKLERCEPHKTARHWGRYIASYPIRCRVTKASELECTVNDLKFKMPFLFLFLTN